MAFQAVFCKLKKSKDYLGWVKLVTILLTVNWIFSSTV